MADPAKRLHSTDAQRRNRLVRLATYASSGTALTLILVKLAAWYITDSIALLSSLIDSLLDLFASLVTLVAVRHALTPADEEHRFGHGKAEPLAALLQSGFIAGSAVLLLIESGERLIAPQPIQATEVGLAVMGVSIAATLGLVGFQRYVLARAGSMAIKADSAHYRADLLANLGVVGALIATGFFDLWIVDPLFGLAIAAFIAKGAWEVGHEAYDMLMDRELPDSERARILDIAMAYPDVHGVHDLRTRRAGPDTFIQMHLELNGALSLTHTHTVADAVEKEIAAAFPEAEVIVHQDPVTPNAPSETDPDATPEASADVDADPDAAPETSSAAPSEAHPRKDDTP